ncbi:MAG: endolytic transglycosylase MltG [Oscillospiraceae bacterium]|nr:endolytic transglycosylase MltG [Oscillospiraceae bacterium]
MEQKELERSENDVLLDDILNSVPEEEISETEAEETAAAEAIAAAADENNEEAKETALEEADTESDGEEESSDSDVESSTEGESGGSDDSGDYDDDYEDDEDEEDTPKKRKKKKRGHGHIIFGLLLSVVIISVSILAAVLILKCSKEFLGIGKSDIELVIEIPMNSSTADIAEQLYSEGIISNVDLFRLFSKFKGADGTYIAGTHTLSPKMDYNTLIETLQEEVENQRETADVVFPEGITLFEAAQKLEEKNVCDAKEFIKVFNAGGFGFDFEEEVRISSLKFYKMEGYFFPDTYQFYVEEDPRVVAKKIYRNFDARVTPDLYGRMRDLDMELEEVLTLASVVQAEAANTRDMKMVASVFFNRLNNPDEYPLLQSDPTTNYVENIIKPNIEFKSETMFKAYDTYQGAGLPPGPICNPGLDAINAVLYPAETDYYYFCSNLETGEFYYAETLDEHNQNLVEAGLV